MHKDRPDRPVNYAVARVRHGRIQKRADGLICLSPARTENLETYE